MEQHSCSGRTISPSDSLYSASSSQPTEGSSGSISPDSEHWLPGIFFRDHFYSSSFIYQICLSISNQLLSENQVSHRGTWVSHKQFPFWMFSLISLCSHRKQCTWRDEKTTEHKACFSATLAEGWKKGVRIHACTANISLSQKPDLRTFRALLSPQDYYSSISGNSTFLEPPAGRYEA